MNSVQKLIKIIEISNDSRNKLNINLRVDDGPNNRICCIIDNCVGSGATIYEAIDISLNAYYDVVKRNNDYYKFYSEVFNFLEKEGVELV